MDARNTLIFVQLPPTPLNGAPDPTGSSSPLVPYTIPFSGTARSVLFGFTGVDRPAVRFDDITFNPVPELRDDRAARFGTYRAAAHSTKARLARRNHRAARKYLTTGEREVFSKLPKRACKPGSGPLTSADYQLIPCLNFGGGQTGRLEPKQASQIRYAKREQGNRHDADH